MYNRKLEVPLESFHHLLEAVERQPLRVFWEEVQGGKMKLNIEYLNKEELKPYANNAKIHTDEQVEQIKHSIEEFGFNDPIAIWKNNEVIEGHGRLLAVMQADGRYNRSSCNKTR